MKIRSILLPALIVLCMAALAALPSLVAGWHDLLQAKAAADPLVAASQYRQAAGRLPRRADLLEKAALSALVGENLQEAIALFGAASARGGLSPTGRISYGDALWIQGERQAALGEWQLAEASGLRSAVLERRLAAAYSGQGDFETARQALLKAVAIDPQDAKSEFSLGLLLAASAPEQSLPHFDRALQLDASLKPRVGPLREGIDQALKNDTAAVRLREAGRALSAAGELQLAVQALQASLEQDPKAAETWALLGQVRESLGEDGQPAMAKALALAPRDPQVQVMEGMFWLRRGDDKQAMPHFVTAAALDPHDPLLQAAQADALARTGDLKGASDAYQQAIALAPGKADYWRLLANFSVDYFYDVSGIGASAALEAQALAPDDYETLVTLGRVALAQAQYSTAGRFFGRAYANDPSQPAAPLYLAIVALEQDQTETAHSYIEKVLVIDPAGPYGRRARLLLERYFSGS